MSNVSFRTVDFRVYLYDRIVGDPTWADEEILVPVDLLDHPCDEVAGFVCRKRGLLIDDPAAGAWVAEEIVWFRRDTHDQPVGSPRPHDDPSVEPGSLIMESVYSLLDQPYREGDFDEPERLWSELRELVQDHELPIYPEMITCGYVADMVSMIYDELVARKAGNPFR